MNGADGLPRLRFLLFGAFTLLWDSREMEVPVNAQRSDALLALCEHPLSRAYQPRATE